jgi:hypothetical protein
MSTKLFTVDFQGFSVRVLLCKREDNTKITTNLVLVDIQKSLGFTTYAIDKIVKTKDKLYVPTNNRNGGCMLRVVTPSQFGQICRELLSTGDKNRVKNWSTDVLNKHKAEVLDRLNRGKDKWDNVVENDDSSVVEEEEDDNSVVEETKIITDSRVVARMFEKNHFDLIKSIREIVNNCTSEEDTRNFIRSSYTSKQKVYHI